MELAASGQDAAATTRVYFYVLTVDVVTDQSTDEANHTLPSREFMTKQCL